MVVEGRVYSRLILSIIRNWPFFLGTGIFIVSAFCICCCLVIPELIWGADVMFGGIDPPPWGGGGGKGLSGVGWPWSWAGERESTRSGALGVLESSKIPREMSDIVGEAAEGDTESLQV